MLSGFVTKTELQLNQLKHKQLPALVPINIAFAEKKTNTEDTFTKPRTFAGV